jgi:hypothetical protein
MVQPSCFSTIEINVTKPRLEKSTDPSRSEAKVVLFLAMDLLGNLTEMTTP